MWRSAVQLCAGLPAEAIFAEHGGLAQLARAPALQAGGQRFESVILHRSPLMGSPKILIFGESGGNRALYAAQRHLIARFAEREEIFDVLNELEVRLRSVNLGLRGEDYFTSKSKN